MGELNSPTAAEVQDLVKDRDQLSHDLADLRAKLEHARAVVRRWEAAYDEMSQGYKRDLAEKTAALARVKRAAKKLNAEALEIADPQNPVRLCYRHVISQFRAALNDEDCLLCDGDGEFGEGDCPRCCGNGIEPDAPHD